jgi:hypothetical protein
MQPPWDGLLPTSFHKTVRISALKVTVTPGSFIVYRLEHSTTLVVGRILDVATSLTSIAHTESHAVVDSPCPADIDTPPTIDQYAKVNIYEDRALLSMDRTFPADTLYSFWQEIVQLEDFIWIPSTFIVGLAFVFMQDLIVRHSVDECCGMKDLFLLKYRLTGDGILSEVPKDSCPPFPSAIDLFSRLWSMCHCELIFNSIQHIRREMQKIMCRVAQSQGDFTVKYAKIPLPSCCWFYIKNQMQEQGIFSIQPVKYSQPRLLLSTGLGYGSIRHFGSMDVLRFDTTDKLEAFRGLFGKTAGYGVRKRRPRYADGKSLLTLNDVVNIVQGRSSQEGVLADDDNDCDNSQAFQRFGVMDEGIDFLYDLFLNVLQIVIRYGKIVVTVDTIECLAGAGVAALPSTTVPLAESVIQLSILPGQEFLDGGYLMVVENVNDNAIHSFYRQGEGRFLHVEIQPAQEAGKYALGAESSLLLER